MSQTMKPQTDFEKRCRLARRVQELEAELAPLRRIAARVLVVIHPDGYVEAISERPNVKVVSIPPPDNAQSEELLAASLSKTWREVYERGKLRDNGLPETWSEAARLTRAAILGWVTLLRKQVKRG